MTKYNLKTGAPAYGMISQDGCRYTVTFLRNKQRTVTGSCSGHNKSVFNECPENMPIIDFREADVSAVISFALNTNSPRECAAIVWDGDPSLDQYIQAAAAVHGAKIITKNDL